jgi:hypothetical protein
MPHPFVNVQEEKETQNGMTRDGAECSNAEMLNA